MRNLVYDLMSTLIAPLLLQSWASVIVMEGKNNHKSPHVTAMGTFVFIIGALIKKAQDLRTIASFHQVALFDHLIFSSSWPSVPDGQLYIVR